MRQFRSLLLAPSLLLGCAASPPAPSAPATPREFTAQASSAAPVEQATAPAVVPAIARELMFVFVAADGGPLEADSSARILLALSQAGYRMGGPGEAHPDALLEVRIEGNQTDRERKLSLVFSAQGKVLDWLAMPVDGQAPSERPFVELVNRLTESPRLLGFAEQAKQARNAARADANRAERISGPAAAVTSSAPALLGEPALRRCRNPRTADACDEVASYLKAHPNGASAEQAKVTLSLSEKRIERLRTR